jgi:hypothetical protein
MKAAINSFTRMFQILAETKRYEYDQAQFVPFLVELPGMRAPKLISKLLLCCSDINLKTMGVSLAFTPTLLA